MKLFALLPFAAAVFSQTQAPLNFDVASVHPAADKPPYTPISAGGVKKGGPGTDDPGRMTFTWMEMRLLLTNAFALPLDQISGPEYAIGQGPRFDIVATVPAGTTKEQANQMLLNLMKERFHLTYHMDKKDFDLYTLVVAKGGPKLKDAEIPDGPPPPAPQIGIPAVAAPQDRDGFPVLPAGRPAAQGRSTNGVTRLTFRMSPPQALLGMLRLQLGPSRTADETGLTGKYDFRLEFSPAGLPGPTGRGYQLPPDAVADPAPDLFTALEKQLGLKLEKSKKQLDIVVIDHIDKQPAEN